jgi:hypothetical protein
MVLMEHSWIFGILLKSILALNTKHDLILIIYYLITQIYKNN